MRRRLLPFAMLVSLWPVAFIALSVATASTGSDSDSTNVHVTVPSDIPAAGVAPKTTTVRLRVDGKTYHCPIGTRAKLNPVDQRIGELELKMTSVRRELRHAVRRLKALDKHYPGRDRQRICVGTSEGHRHAYDYEKQDPPEERQRVGVRLGA
jgi:hypothetical protein